MSRFITDPAAIERRSMEIIAESLRETFIPPAHMDVVKRVIHTTADFDYAQNLIFAPGVTDRAIAALSGGATVVTDTEMARAGINKRAAESLGVAVRCFIGDTDIAAEAKKRGITRSAVAVEKAADLPGAVIMVVGNAPTALIRIAELVEAGRFMPRIVVGVPVGFVNVVESKELIADTAVPYIVAMGRKGGSNVAAAIVNALLYRAVGRVL